MKCLIILSTLTILSFSSISQRDVNNFIFSSGMEPNRWNHDMIYDTYSYFSRMDDSNEAIYTEAVYVIESYCMSFDKPTEDNSFEDEIYSFYKLIFEKDMFEMHNETRIDNTYENQDVKIVVGINNTRSYIRVYPKR